MLLANPASTCLLAVTLGSKVVRSPVTSGKLFLASVVLLLTVKSPLSSPHILVSQGKEG